MSIIVRAGNMKTDWSPKEEVMSRTASTEAKEVKEEVNPLYEAAKSFMATASDKCCKECKMPKGLCKCEKTECKEEDKKEEGKKEAACMDSEAPVIEIETPEGEKLEEVSKDKVEQAVEKLDEVVVELKDAVKGTEIAEEKEIEIEIEDDGKMPEIPGKDVSQSEIIVESTPESVCSCASKKKDKKDKKEEKKEEKKEVEMDKSASTEEEFCRFAMLSPKNKKDIKEYWTSLGFPKDYVDLMTKDYEK